ncbi:MAG: AAA family ATPase [Nanoarchaeota archaeon]|jgi:hypothetical protein|nr:AAA family ATPase [Nanoarchaeota archaeon]
MNKDEILSILLDWNFWKKDIDIGIERKEYIEKALKYMNSNMVICLYGVRRAGKTFLLRQIAKELIKRNIVDSKDILIVNFEDVRFREYNIDLLDQIFNIFLQELKPKDPIIFLDEINKIDEWERWVRTMHELKKAKIFVSGSSAKLLKGEISTLLTGRHLDIVVFPFSFEEILYANKININDKLEILNNLNRIKKILEEYLKFGGFPEVVLSKDDEIKKKILLQYFDDIIEKDIIFRYNIREKEKIKILAKFYLSNISSLTTFSSLEDFLKINKLTIERFSNYMAESFLIFFVKMYHPSLKKQEKAPRKVYSIDTGLSNAVGFRLFETKGKLMENLVAIELKRREKEFYYWKEYGKLEGHEVDFLIKENNIIKELIQVSYINNIDEIDRREIRSLIKASNLLNCNDLKIITWDLEDKIIKDNKEIKLIPLWKWLLNR